VIEEEADPEAAADLARGSAGAHPTDPCLAREKTPETGRGRTGEKERGRK